MHVNYPERLPELESSDPKLCTGPEAKWKSHTSGGRGHVCPPPKFRHTRGSCSSQAPCHRLGTGWRGGGGLLASGSPGPGAPEGAAGHRQRHLLPVGPRALLGPAVGTVTEGLKLTEALLPGQVLVTSRVTVTLFPVYSTYAASVSFTKTNQLTQIQAVVYVHASRGACCPVKEN